MSLGKDLASIRNDQGLSLEEIQSSIKIPLLTLKSIENDSIFDHPEHNQTYVRSFIRSYAKALKIDDETIVSALDAHEAGKYDHELLGPEAPVEDDEELTDAAPEEESSEKDAVKSPKKSPAPTSKTEKKKAPGIDSVNWADMGRKFTLQDSGSKVKVAVGSVFLVIIIIASLGYYYWDGISEFLAFSDPQIIENPTQEPPASILDAEDPANIPTQDPVTPEEVNTPITLGDTLSVVVYAAYDKLEPVRVTSDLNWRTNPFWMESGRAFRFNFRDTLLVRGQYSRMLLLFNGNVIENPTNQYFNTSYNSIMLTRSALENSPYLDPPPAEFPYEVGLPDSIEIPIQF